MRGFCSTQLSFCCERHVFPDVTTTVSYQLQTACLAVTVLGLAHGGLLTDKAALQQLDASVASHLFTAIIS